jgi:hypothetical protein
LVRLPFLLPSTGISSAVALLRGAIASVSTSIGLIDISFSVDISFPVHISVDIDIYVVVNATVVPVTMIVGDDRSPRHPDAESD